MAALHRMAPPWLSAFYDAYLSGDPQRLDSVLADEVTWLISGPAERVDVFGMRRGKAEVIELITRIIPCYQKLTGFEFDQVLVQGDHVAAFGRVCSQQRETARAIRFAFAHFMRFRDGKVISLRAVADSFDALEQLMGCRIALVIEKDRIPIEANGDIASV
jgi:ketosteroid isomerase-like protein